LTNLQLNRQRLEKLWPGCINGAVLQTALEGVLAITVAEWTRDIALILSGVAGLLHWGWWFPVLFGAIAAVVREASQGFVLIQHCGSRYLIRSLTTTCLLCGIVATVAYVVSVI
jgi:hypothetical protein